MRSAVVLAGGRSTRFGAREKATATLDGEPLLRRVATRIAPAVDEVIVNCREGQRERFETTLAGLDAALDGADLRFATDPTPGGGPLVGVRTGARVARGDLVAFVPCDVPCVTAALPRHLLDALSRRRRSASTSTDGKRGIADGGRGRAVVPLLEDRSRPLLGAYETDAVERAAAAALADGDRAARAVLDRLEFLAVTPPVAPETLVDVDTLAALRALRRRVQGRNTVE